MRVSLKHVKTQKYLFSILTRYSELVPSKKSNGEFNEKLKKKYEEISSLTSHSIIILIMK